MLYPATIFIGAFLLFQIQPIIAKTILPLLGGGATIWTTCLLLFQGLLLCGYFYSHCLTKLSNIKHQAIIHLVLLCTSLFFLPVSISDRTRINPEDSPLMFALVLSLATIGLPYLLLSATGPLLQRWISYTANNPQPYKLYSLSNTGSLLALLSYPFFFEMLFSLSTQTLSWSFGYFVYVLGISVICIKLFRNNTDTISTVEKMDHRPLLNKKIEFFLWAILSGIGVVLLVSTTNAMTQNVPPVPFLWILPLPLYWKGNPTKTKNSSASSMLMARASTAYTLVLIATFLYLNSMFIKGDIVRSRNFYGILKVKDIEEDGKVLRRLVDGTTLHGMETLHEKPDTASMSMTYYRNNTGVALALEYFYRQNNVKAGFIGLGAGTLAAYGRAGDNYRFYELNPDVKSIADEYFTYLDMSEANVTVTLGDARVSLANELEELGSHNYQVLVVDAFSGDSIPTHLLTREAFTLYWKHLHPSGVLAIHISNSHLDLTSVVRSLALHTEKQALHFITRTSGHEINDVQWVIVTNNQEFISDTKIKRMSTAWSDKRKDTKLWTDDYNNLFSVLKLSWY